MTDEEILAIAAEAQDAIISGHHFGAAEAADLLRFARLIAARVETYQCECSADDACMFARQRDAAVQEMAALRAFAEMAANCPCCDGTLRCDPECTFEDDCPDDVWRMMAARDALTG